MLGIYLDSSAMLDIDRDIQKLTKAESNRVMKEAVRAGARVIRDETKRRAPNRTGKLKRNIVVVSADSHNAGVVVRSKGKADNPNNAFYWRFIENGTSKMLATPFFRPAFDSKEKEAGSAVISRLAQAIDEVLMKW